MKYWEMPMSSIPKRAHDPGSLSLFDAATLGYPLSHGNTDVVLAPLKLKPNSR
jgi:hypothetical protein